MRRVTQPTFIAGPLGAINNISLTSIKLINNMKIALVFLFSLCALFSCEWLFKPGPCDASGPIIVYKTKQDYSNNVTIQLSNDHKSVTCTPGPSDVAEQRPIKLANGYLLKRMCGDAVLSLTIDKYATENKFYSNAELLSMVIDTDPYIEKYECCKCTGRDTSKINDLIRNNQLNKCDIIK